jgi:hypothetical protein
VVIVDTDIGWMLVPHSGKLGRHADIDESYLPRGWCDDPAFDHPSMITCDGGALDTYEKFHRKSLTPTDVSGRHEPLLVACRVASVPRFRP